MEISHRFHRRSQLPLGVEDLERLQVVAEVARLQALLAGVQPRVVLRLRRRHSLVHVHDQETLDEILRRRREGERKKKSFSRSSAALPLSLALLWLPKLVEMRVINSLIRLFCPRARLSNGSGGVLSDEREFGRWKLVRASGQAQERLPNGFPSLPLHQSGSPHCTFYCKVCNIRHVYNLPSSFK